MIARNPFWNKFEQMFVCLDADEDGVISMDEWKAHISLSKCKAKKFNQQKTLYSTQTVFRVKHYCSVETGCTATLTSQIHGVMPGCN